MAAPTKIRSAIFVLDGYATDDPLDVGVHLPDLSFVGVVVVPGDLIEPHPHDVPGAVRRRWGCHFHREPSRGGAMRSPSSSKSPSFMTQTWVSLVTPLCQTMHEAPSGLSKTRGPDDGPGQSNENWIVIFVPNRLRGERSCPATSPLHFQT